MDRQRGKPWWIWALIVLAVLFLLLLLFLFLGDDDEDNVPDSVDQGTSQDLDPGQGGGVPGDSGDEG